MNFSLQHLFTKASPKLPYSGYPVTRLPGYPKTLALLTTLTLSACAVGPDYKTPTLSLPGEWLNQLTTSAPATIQPGQNWWQAYNDATLNQLITSALTHNGSLRIATANVKEARASRLSATSRLLPGIGISAEGTRGSVINNNDREAEDTTTTAGFTASWELDLFGANRRAAEASRANLAARRAAESGTRIALLAEVANSYFALKAAQQQVSLTTELLALQQRTDNLIQTRYKVGAASGRETAQSEAQTASIAAQLANLRQAEMSQRMSLIALTGISSTVVENVAHTSSTLPLDALINTPATVIANRPDVREAERNLAAATAVQGVAIANWFPKISLTGFFGVQNSLLYGTDNVWSVGGSVLTPFIDSGRIRAITGTADARQEAALASYEQTVRNAVADVETAMSGMVNAQQANLAQQRAAAAAAKSANLAEISYKAGALSLTDLLLAQATSLQAQQQAAQAQAAAHQAYSNLYRAIGSY